MVVGVNYPAGRTGIGISLILFQTGVFQIKLALFVHFFAVRAFVKQLGRGFALGFCIFVNNAPFLVVALDVIGVIRAEVDDGISVADAVLIGFITFVFTLLGAAVIGVVDNFVTAVGQKADSRGKRRNHRKENQGTTNSPGQQSWDDKKTSQFYFETIQHCKFLSPKKTRQNIKTL